MDSEDTSWENWRVSLLVQELPPNFTWILAASPGCQNTTSCPVLSWFPFFCFWYLVGFVHNGLSRSIVNISWHRHWKVITFSSILSFLSLITTWCCCRWWRRAWRKSRTKTLLSWRCPWSWLIRIGRRTRWQAWKHDRNEVLRVALCSNPVLNEMCFMTVDPFIRLSVFIEKLFKRQYCWRVFEDFHSEEYIQFFDIHCVFFMRLHFSTGGNDYRRITRFRQSIHFSITQVFFTVKCIDAPESTTNFRFRFKIWCRQAPIFPRWEECVTWTSASPPPTKGRLRSWPQGCRWTTAPILPWTSQCGVQCHCGWGPRGSHVLWHRAHAKHLWHSVSGPSSHGGRGGPACFPFLAAGHSVGPSFRQVRTQCAALTVRCLIWPTFSLRASVGAFLTCTLSGTRFHCSSAKNSKKNFWPASPVLRGHLALATLSPPEIGPQILERWDNAHEFLLGIYIRALDFRFEFQCDVHSFRQLHCMSELFRKIWWQLRRLHVLREANQLSCIGWVVCVVSLRSIVQLILLQHGYFTFVIFFETFCWAVHQHGNALKSTYPKNGIQFRYCRTCVPLFTEWIGASSLEVIFAVITDFGQTDFGQSQCFSGMADFGQNRLWFVVCGVLCCVVLSVWRGYLFHGFKIGRFHVWVLVFRFGLRTALPLTALPLDRPSPGPPKISLFFFPLPPQNSFFSSLSGGLLVEFWWCLFKLKEHEKSNILLTLGKLVPAYAINP